MFAIRQTAGSRQRATLFVSSHTFLKPGSSMAEAGRSPVAAPAAKAAAPSSSCRRAWGLLPASPVVLKHKLLASTGLHISA